MSLSATRPAAAQTESTQNPTRSLCDRNSAIESIQQQLELTRTFDDGIRRITVLNQAAHLLWPLKQEKARAAFKEAFEIAVQNEKEKEKEKNDLWRQHRALMPLQTPDQRYVVIRAVARRDSAWAKKLTEQVLKLDRQSSEEALIKDYPNDLLTAQKLLDSATQLISTDLNAAVDLARASLNYPASFMISRFLYDLAAVNQQLADQLYDQALLVYGNRPMREFLYLATYPFAFRDSGSTPIFGFYRVPENFQTNSLLQRKFVQILLRRSQQALEAPLDEGDNFNEFPGTGHVLRALMRVEFQVREHLPDLLEAVSQTKEKVFVSLSAEVQKSLTPSGRNEISSAPAKTFGERIETAEKTPGLNQRDDLIAEAILSSSVKESLNNLMDAAEKISDSDLRGTLIEWLYVRQAEESASRKEFDLAEKLASKVEGREQKAFLLNEIARGLLSTPDTQTRAHEILEEAVTVANKAGATIFAGRSLLASSNLLAKMDVGRSLAVLGDAINCINRLEAPDFSRDNQTLVKEIKRKSAPGRFIVNFYMPGPDPETAFRELAKIDFNDAFAQTNTFNDKFQRVMTALAVADVCLQETERRRNDKPKKTTSQP